MGNKPEGAGATSGIVILLVLVVNSAVLGMLSNKDILRAVSTVRSQAIERGYALYCQTTGDFAWKGECEDEEG